jgi:hypothetical protein
MLLTRNSNDCWLSAWTGRASSNAVGLMPVPIFQTWHSFGHLQRRSQIFSALSEIHLAMTNHPDQSKRSQSALTESRRMLYVKLNKKRAALIPQT